MTMRVAWVDSSLVSLYDRFVQRFQIAAADGRIHDQTRDGAHLSGTLAGRLAIQDVVDGEPVVLRVLIIVQVFADRQPG